jgi:hypothetical protein
VSMPLRSCRTTSAKERIEGRPKLRARPALQQTRTQGWMGLLSSVS